LWQGWRIAGNTSQDDLLTTDHSFCPEGDLLLGLSPTATPTEPPSVQARARTSGFMHHVRSRSLGFALPVEAAFPAQPDIACLLRYDQVLATTEDGVGVSALDSPPAGHRSSNGSYIQLCLAYTGSWSGGRTGKTIHLVGYWRQHETSLSPWEEWSTGTDDTLESVARTVNLDTFFRVLKERLAALTPHGIGMGQPFLEITYPE
jgi:hypothetical protein